MKKVIVFLMIIVSATSVFAQKSSSTSFEPLINEYLALKNALAKDNAGLANEKANQLAKVAKSVLASNVAEDSKLLVQSLLKSAEEIAAEKAIKVQRNSFWQTSTAMIKLAKLHPSNTTLYVQYCPMAKKSWINEVEAIQNPFYGRMMYDCGEVTETLAKK